RGSKLVLARSITSSPRPLITARRSHTLNPLTSSGVMVGGIESSCLAITTSRRAGPSCFRASAAASGSSPGSSTRLAKMPIALANRRKIGIVEVDIGAHKPCRFHLERHEAENAIVEDHNFDRQLHLGERDQVAHQHANPAVAGQ